MRYAKLERPRGWIDENDVGCAEMPKTCQKFKCQDWKDGKQIAPVLELNHRGFMECPKCCNSYGRP